MALEEDSHSVAVELSDFDGAPADSLAAD